VVRRALLAITLSLPTIAAAQENTPPPAPQNPSPMVELTRAHDRIPERELAGSNRTFEGPLGKPVAVFIPATARTAKAIRLVVHFHGSAFLPAFAVSQLKGGYAVASVQLGAGNGIYDRNFSDPAAFDSLRAAFVRTVANALGRPVTVRSVILSGFSAGHGAIRAILRDSAHFAAVDAVLLLDGLHTGYEPEGKVIHEGARLNESNLLEFLRFARAAREGRKRFLITHSEIFPGTFASTTETANYLLTQLGMTRKAVLQWGPLGMQQTSEARSGRFVVLGFAGNSAPDHIDHFHGMYHFLAALEKLQ
jgi:hypothetical protein